MSVRRQRGLQRLEVAPAKQHRGAGLRGALVRREIEFRGVDRDPAPAQHTHRIAHERQAVLDAAKVLVGATRPAEIEIGQIAGNGVHVDASIPDRIAKAPRLADAAPIQGCEIGAGVLRRYRPASVACSVCIHIGRQDFGTVTREQRDQRLGAHAKAQAAHPGNEHAALMQHLRQVYPFPLLAMVSRRLLQALAPILVQRESIMRLAAYIGGEDPWTLRRGQTRHVAAEAIGGSAGFACRHGPQLRPGPYAEAHGIADTMGQASGDAHQCVPGDKAA